jgi:hypothetical protein
MDSHSLIQDRYSPLGLLSLKESSYVLFRLNGGSAKTSLADLGSICGMSFRQSP